MFFPVCSLPAGRQAQRSVRQRGFSADLTFGYFVSRQSNNSLRGPARAGSGASKHLGQMPGRRQILVHRQINPNAYLHFVLKTLNKIFFIILGIDFIIVTTDHLIGLNDNLPQPFLDTLDWIFRYILGFPLWLINPSLPFFIDIPFLGLVLTLVNNAILSLLIWCFVTGIKKLFR